MILKPLYLLFFVTLVSAASAYGHAKQRLDLFPPLKDYKKPTDHERKLKYEDQKKLDPRTSFILERRAQRNSFDTPYNSGSNAARHYSPKQTRHRPKK